MATMTPARGRRAEVEALQRRILALDAAQPGFVMAVQFGEPGDLGPLGRVIIWESEEAANHASLSEEVQALRSQVNLAIEDGHTDVIYHVTGDILGA
jgi:hypothetical protein